MLHFILPLTAHDKAFIFKVYSSSCWNDFPSLYNGQWDIPLHAYIYVKLSTINFHLLQTFYGPADVAILPGKLALTLMLFNLLKVCICIFKIPCCVEILLRLNYNYGTHYQKTNLKIYQCVSFVNNYSTNYCYNYCIFRDCIFATLPLFLKGIVSQT